MGAMKVRDFAKCCGCTTQNIYQHLHTYQLDLEGHTWKGPGRSGVYLDDEAQAFLKSVMYPKEIAESTLVNEIMALREELLRMSTENNGLASKLATAVSEKERAEYEVKRHLRSLEAANEEKQRQAEALDQARQQLQDAQQAEKTAKDEAETLRGQLAAQEAKNEALMQRGFWARLRNKGVD